jgi:hypothetical protein
MKHNWIIHILATFSFCLLGLKAMAAQPPGQVVPPKEPAESKGDVRVDRPLGFQAWKQNRIDKARGDIHEFKRPKVSSPGSEGETSDKAGKTQDNQDLNRQAERLRQLEFNLEIALGLTIHDYFALYLKDKTKAEMAEAVGQLNPEELSELLVSYRDALYGPPMADKEGEKSLR